MYLYIPIGERTVVIENYTISSTGLQLDEPVECLNAQIGILLTLETDETHAESPATILAEPIIPEVPVVKQA